jgi:uncharacterized protein
MNNPFKFGSVVDDPYFTDRTEELAEIEAFLNSGNHLILMSPRRFGKTSLIRKAVKNSARKLLFLDLQLINSTEDLAGQYLRRIYHLFPAERIKRFIRNFRVIPSISLNPVSNQVEISFQPAINDLHLLEDVFNLPEQLGKPENRILVVLDEFQDINRIGKDLDRKLRSIMQLHKNINYILLGSQESMMREIFEKKKSPFYHFGQLFSLDKIRKENFRPFLTSGLSGVTENAGGIAEEILDFTDGHPYYTQQLAFNAWNLLNQEASILSPVEKAINQTVQIHDFDYQRLWMMLINTDKKVLTKLAQKENPASGALSQTSNLGPTSTIFSSLKRLMQSGHVIKTVKGYEIDDPFFKKWITDKRNQMTIE